MDGRKKKKINAYIWQNLEREKRKFARWPPLLSKSGKYGKARARKKDPFKKK